MDKLRFTFTSSDPATAAVATRFLHLIQHVVRDSSSQLHNLVLDIRQLLFALPHAQLGDEVAGQVSLCGGVFDDANFIPQLNTMKSSMSWSSSTGTLLIRAASQFSRHPSRTCVRAFSLHTHLILPSQNALRSLSQEVRH